MTDESLEAKRATRDTSTIAFPYLDLDDAVGVARAMHKAGGVPLDRDQLAAQMGQRPGSGNFSIKIGAARMFGLLESAQGRYSLTPLGYEILDPAREKRAKASAFLNVPLYRRAYDEWKGRPMPPRPLGLENAFVAFGVAPKQKDKARHAFDRSARIAGFFANGQEDRLVFPIIGLAPDEAIETASISATAQVGSLGIMGAAPTVTSQSALNPFIQGLLDELPARGTPWGLQDQAAWLQAAAAAFRMIYKRPDGDIGELSVTVKTGTGA